MNHDPRSVIRVGTDLRFVDQSRPWDKVNIFCETKDEATNMVQRWDKDYEFNDGV